MSQPIQHRYSFKVVQYGQEVELFHHGTHGVNLHLYNKQEVGLSHLLLSNCFPISPVIVSKLVSRINGKTVIFDNVYFLNKIVIGHIIYLQEESV